MSRVVTRLILDVVGTTALALVLLSAFQWFVGGFGSEGLPEGVRVLFNFMDVGLAVWVVLLIVAAVRGRTRGGGPSAPLTYLFLVIGAVLNLIVVAIVGFVQGGWAMFVVVFAIEAGLAALVAGAVVVPIVHRVLRKAPE